MENNLSKSISDKIPFWRDIRVLRVLFQVLFLIGVLLLAGILYANMLRGLRGLGLTLNLDFFNDEAGFGISEGIAYEPSDTYLRAFWVGVVNTIRVSIIGIVCATILGLVIGIARLSSNWLVRNIAAIYVECFRNIPLLATDSVLVYRCNPPAAPRFGRASHSLKAYSLTNEEYICPRLNLHRASRFGSAISLEALF